MINWGINALNHGSSVAVFVDNNLQTNVFDKNDELSPSTIQDILKYGDPDNIYWYEQPWLKKSRQLYAGQYHRVFDLKVLPKNYLKKININYKSLNYTPHHGSHAAAGYYTSPFDNCAVVVLDAIGDWECATIWKGHHGELTKVWSRDYPNSLGLFYSAFTQLIGLSPIHDEYLLEQMSSQGDWQRYYEYVNSYFNFNSVLEMNYNFHRGAEHWDYEIDNDQTRYDIAAAIQRVFEEQVSQVMRTAKELTGCESLVYMGGCAMNRTANKKVVEPKFKYIWSLPQPGDPSSSIGAVLYHTKQRCEKDLGVVKHIDIRV